jgi:hypothetical protein
MVDTQKIELSDLSHQKFEGAIPYMPLQNIGNHVYAIDGSMTRRAHLCH